MTKKPIYLSSVEIDTLLGYLLRVSETSQSESIRRVAKSLFALLSREKYTKDI